MRIEKRDYSRAPWRLVTSEGQEVYAPLIIDHPDLGPTVVSGPMCGDTKAECIAKALALLEQLMSRQRE